MDRRARPNACIRTAPRGAVSGSGLAAATARFESVETVSQRSGQQIYLMASFR